MEDKNLDNGVKLPDNAPAGEGIKDKSVVVPPTDDNGSEKPNYEKLFYDTLDEVARVSEERDNYKIGLINAKKGNGEDIGTNTEIESVKKSLGTLTDLVKTVIKENKEVRTALKSRNAISAPAGASGEEKTPNKETFWTEDQIKFLQKKGIDPNKVKDNYIKSRENK